MRIREAVRAILLDPEDRVLLVRFEFPTATVWALPGGGIEPGEDRGDALRRELAEELGLTGVQVGPAVWERTHIIPFLDGKWDGQHEHAHLIRVEPFEPRPMLSWDELNRELIFELRWWTLDEVLAADEVLFAPRRLGTHLARLLSDGPPAELVDIGV